MFPELFSRATVNDEIEWWVDGEEKVVKVCKKIDDHRNVIFALLNSRNVINKFRYLPYATLIHDLANAKLKMVVWIKVHGKFYRNVLYTTYKA